MPLNASSNVRSSVSLVVPAIAGATAGLLEQPRKFLDGLMVWNTAAGCAANPHSTRAEDVDTLRDAVATLEKRCRDPDTDDDARTVMQDQIQAFLLEIARHGTLQRPTFTAIANVPSIATSFATLFRTASQAVSTRVTCLSQAIERSTEHRKQINAALQPPLHTDLEKLCGSPRTGSTLAQWLSPSRSDKIVRLRSKEGAESNPNAGRYGAAALAVVSGHPSRLKALLRGSAGAIDLDRVSEVFNKTALGIAIERMDEVCIRLLLEAGAHVMTDELAMGARSGDFALFQRLHNHAKAHPAPGGIDLQPALGEAVVANHVAIARHVLESGIRLSPANTSLLGIAAEKGHTGMLALLQHHASDAYIRASHAVAATDHPLMRAILGAHRSTVAALLPMQTDRSFVQRVSEGLAESLRQASFHDQQRFALIAEDLRAWLAAPAAAIGADAARPSSAAVTAQVVALPAGRTGSTPSPPPLPTKRVFAPSLPFKSVMHGMV